MTNEEYSKIITEIETLPTGGITYKRINGKAYAYYQWREDGKQRSRRIQPCSEVHCAAEIFSTYQDGTPIRTREFLLIDTETWEYRGIQ